MLHGWPGLRIRELVEFAATITGQGKRDDFDFSYGGYEMGVVAGAAPRRRCDDCPGRPDNQGCEIQDKRINWYTATIKAVVTGDNAAVFE